MNIGLVIPSQEARHGGPTQSVRGLASGLAADGHAVDLLTTGQVDASLSRDQPGMTTHAFPRLPPLPLARSPGLRNQLLSHRYDIVHNHGLWQCPLHYAHLAAKRFSVPLVVSPRGMMSPWAWRHRRWKKILSALLVHPGAFRAARGWHATSEDEAADIRRLGFTQPICVAPNGVLAPDASVEAGEAAHWRELLPALAGRRVALFYSRLHAKKRVLELIDLWLSKPRHDWVLLIAGIPEQYTVNQIDAYLIRNSGVGRVVVQDGAGHPPPYAIASLFLLPSHSENFGLVVAEALVRGVPVLTTDTTPWQELSSRSAGDCVPWETYGPALDGLLAESPESLAARGEQARTWSRAAFSWNRVATPLAGFYAQLIAAG